MHVMRSVTYFRSHEKIHMAELQVQEIVTLDSTDVQEEIQVESEPAPKSGANGI